MNDQLTHLDREALRNVPNTTVTIVLGLLQLSVSKAPSSQLSYFLEQTKSFKKVQVSLKWCKIIVSFVDLNHLSYSASKIILNTTTKYCKPSDVCKLMRNSKFGLSHLRQEVKEIS